MDRQAGSTGNPRQANILDHRNFTVRFVEISHLHSERNHGNYSDLECHLETHYLLKETMAIAQI